MSEKIYPFLKSDGFVLPAKKGCLNCTHCSDVWWDYSNGVYYTECTLKEEPPCCDQYKNDGTKPVTKEEYNQIKKKENDKLIQDVWEGLR